MNDRIEEIAADVLRGYRAWRECEIWLRLSDVYAGIAIE